MKALIALPVASAMVLFTLTSAAPERSDECSSSKRAATVSWAGKDIVETALAAGQFKTLATALSEAGLVDALRGEGPFTVFAPTDAAFAKLPKGALEDLLKPENKATLTAILTYHVAPGRFGSSDVVRMDYAPTLAGQRIDFVVEEGAVRVDGATVVKPDIECSNGVIHVIDEVILPNTNDIVATAVEAGAFKTLAAALEAAHLVQALQGDGPFTVFAPTDDAFAKLPAGTVEGLLEKKNRDTLAAILKYHVVPGRVYAAQAIEAKSAETLQGTNVRARIRDGRMFINDAQVIRSDLETTNGVIHVIDAVLMPR